MSEELMKAEELMKLPDPYTAEDVHLAYRELIKSAHPDAHHDGSMPNMDAADLNSAYGVLRKEIRSLKPGETRRRTYSTTSPANPAGQQQRQAQQATAQATSAQQQQQPQQQPNQSRIYSYDGNAAAKTPGKNYPMSVNSKGWWHEYAWAASSDPVWFRGAMWAAEHFPWTLLIWLFAFLTLPMDAGSSGAYFFHVIFIFAFAIIGWKARRPIHDFMERVFAFPFKLLYRAIGTPE